MAPAQLAILKNKPAVCTWEKGLVHHRVLTELRTIVRCDYIVQITRQIILEQAQVQQPRV